MRFLILILLSFLISSCANTQLAEWTSQIRPSGYDFREYTEQGFLFTPEIYTEPYEAIGLVEVTFIPGIVKASNQTNPERSVGHSQGLLEKGYNLYNIGYTYYYIEEPDPDKLIAEMYTLAYNLGANALSNFQITIETLPNNGFDVETVKVSGFAIKRL